MISRQAQHAEHDDLAERDLTAEDPERCIQVRKHGVRERPREHRADKHKIEHDRHERGEDAPHPRLRTAAAAEPRRAQCGQQRCERAENHVKNARRAQQIGDRAAGEQPPRRAGDEKRQNAQHLRDPALDRSVTDRRQKHRQCGIGRARDRRSGQLSRGDVHDSIPPIFFVAHVVRAGVWHLRMMNCDGGYSTPPPPRCQPVCCTDSRSIPAGRGRTVWTARCCAYSPRAF